MYTDLKHWLYADKGVCLNVLVGNMKKKLYFNLHY